MARSSRTMTSASIWPRTATLLEIVRTAPDDVERLLLVGHNPGPRGARASALPARRRSPAGRGRGQISDRDSGRDRAAGRPLGRCRRKARAGSCGSFGRGTWIRSSGRKTEPRDAARWHFVNYLPPIPRPSEGRPGCTSFSPGRPWPAARGARLPEPALVALFLLAAAFFLFVDPRTMPIVLWDESRNAVNALEMRQVGLEPGHHLRLRARSVEHQAAAPDLADDRKHGPVRAERMGASTALRHRRHGDPADPSSCSSGRHRARSPPG